MPSLIKPTTIISNFTTQTTQGEVTVNLNLKLTLEVAQSGEISMKISNQKEELHKSEFVPQIPDWDKEELIDFGKEVK